MQDLWYAARALRRQPGFALIAILTLAVGIGASSAIYSVVDATLWRTLPFQEPHRLARVFLTQPVTPGTPFPADAPWSYPKYETFRQLQQPFENTAVYRGSGLRLSGTDEPEKINGEFVGAGYFSILGVRPQIGRAFLPEEDTTPGMHPVAVLGHGIWQRRFGGDAAILGKTLTLDDKVYTVVGVAPPGFRGLTGRADLWLPATMYDPAALKRRWSHSWEVIARLNPGVSMQMAQAAAIVLGRQVEAAHPSPEPGSRWGARAASLESVRVEPEVRKAVLVLFGAAGFVLLAACVNLTNLLLARNASRRAELAIRQAVGAGRWRLVRQLLTESALLASLGGLGGVALAWWGLGAFHAVDLAAGDPLGFHTPDLTLVGLTAIRIDLRVLLFTFGVTLATCMLSGLAPAIGASRPDLIRALKHSDAQRGGWGLLASRHALVVVEVALALVLLTGAGLMIKSFGKVLGTKIGIDADKLLTVSLDPSGQYDETTITGFFDELETRLSGLAGVVSVGRRDSYPLSGCCTMTLFWYRDRTNPPQGSEPIVGAYYVSPSYFRTMRIPLVRGRFFTTADRKGAPKVVLVSESAVRRLWPGENPLGRVIGLADGWFDDRAEVIGVVADVRNMPPGNPEPPAIYVSYLQAPQAYPAVLFVRTANDPGALAQTVRQQIKAVNRNVIVTDSKPMRQRIVGAASKTRFSAALLAVFAAITVVLAALGIYGVLSYSVAQRTREFGVRIALGARPADILAMVLRRGLGLTLAGLAIGMALAFWLARLMATLLYEVEPYDAPTFALTAAGLACVALLACYIPARRAASADALAALKAE
jgi:putative ABC transport system permease protein